ncbi:MAG: 16S rRNA (cytosine(967)-C(5))-methyltransferase RsmB [Bacteroidota bacterium]|nr:16S rRNA (cytosine(967)-C(5))-methyltransferase RsmB [Bacteroidota bacterium]
MDHKPGRGKGRKGLRPSGLGRNRQGGGRSARSEAASREERPRLPGKDAPVRVLAARELDAMAERDTFIGLQAATRTGNPDRDRSVRDMVAGVVRWQRYLDFLIASFYKGDADTLEPAMRTILRIGLYGLLFSRQPDHAVLNETVEAAKMHVRPGAAGLTNGLLRSVLRKQDALPEPEGSMAHRLSIRYSHPEWLVEQWLHQFGDDETEQLLAHNNQRPQYGLHLAGDVEQARKALQAAGIEYEPSALLPDMVRMKSLQSVVRGDWLDQGRAFVQDEGAALVAGYAQPEEGSRILDLCAAPGGKTMQLAQAAGASGEVVACDIQEKRLRLVAENAGRLGLDNVSTEARDARDPDASWLGAFDVVLLDAPCSGLGVLSKRADMRWRRSPKEIEEMVVLQRDMLAAAASCVRPGGLLVYSTCTTEPRENERQVEGFLETHREFSREPAPKGFPVQCLTEDGDYLSLPHHTGMDGAYAARLRRNPDRSGG